MSEEQHNIKRGFDAAVAGDSCPDTFLDSDVCKAQKRSGYEQGLKVKYTSEYLASTAAEQDDSSSGSSSDSSYSYDGSSTYEPPAWLVKARPWIIKFAALACFFLVIWLTSDRTPTLQATPGEILFYGVCLIVFGIPFLLLAGFAIGLLVRLGIFIFQKMHNPMETLIQVVTALTVYLCVSCAGFRFGSWLLATQPFLTAATVGSTLIGNVVGVLIGLLVAEVWKPGPTSSEKVRSLCLRSIFLIISIALLPWLPMLKALGVVFS